MQEHQPPRFSSEEVPSDPSPAESRPTYAGPESVIATDTLDFLVEGVRVRFVPLTPEETVRATQEGRSGWYTRDVNDPRVPVKEIHYNPSTLSGDPGIVRAISLHEALHHSRPVAALYRRIGQIARRASPPAAFRATPRLEALFPIAVQSYLGNVITDRFLEFYAIRGNYRDQFLHDYRAKVECSKSGRDLRSSSLAQQFVQRFLGAERFFGGESQDTVDPRVEEEFAKLGNALEAIDRVDTYEQPLHTERDETQDIAQKAHAFEHLLLPAFVRMLDAEAQEQTKEHPGEKPGEPSPEFLEALAQLLEQLIAEGQAQFAPKSEHDPNQPALLRARQLPNAKPKPRAPGEEPPPPPEPIPASGDPESLPPMSEMERALMAASAARAAGAAARGRGLAERHGVSPETVLAYERYRAKYRQEISRLRDRIVVAMREERTAILGLTEREGEVTPGLEMEAIAAAAAGEVDATTHLRFIEPPQCTRVRLLFVVDVSGSMAGARMDAARAAYVIIGDAFAEARAELEEDALVADDEEVIEMGLLAFEGSQTLVQPIGPLPDEGTRYRNLEALTPGGGTNDYAALERAEAEIEARAKVSAEQYIDLVVVLTDGEGDQSLVRAFCDRVRRRAVFSLGAFGFGTSSVAASYGGRPGGIDAVYGADFADPTHAIPAVGAFLGGRIERELDQRGARR